MLSTLSQSDVSESCILILILFYYSALSSGSPNTYRRHPQTLGIAYKVPRPWGLPTSSASFSKPLLLTLKACLALAEPPARMCSVLVCRHASARAVPTTRYNLHLLAASRFISSAKPCPNLQRETWTCSPLSHSCVLLEQLTCCLVFVFLANLSSLLDHGLAKGLAQKRDSINSV